MKLTPSLLAVVSASSLLPSEVNGFGIGALRFPTTPTSSGFHIRPDLIDLTEKQQDVTLQINLDIGGAGDEAHTAIRGMVFELHKSSPNEDDHTVLPGADGWSADCSSGHRRVKVLKDGGFVDMRGSQQVEVLKPSWEMIWPKERPSGSLVIGFELPQDYRRNQNGAVFPSGNIFLRFPIWSKDSMEHGKAEHERILSEHQKLVAEQEHALHVHNTSRNPIEKIISLRNAIIADEKLEEFSLEVAGLTDLRNVMKLHDDVYMEKTGTIHLQQGNFDGKTVHKILGRADATSPSSSERTSPLLRP